MNEQAPSTIQSAVKPGLIIGLVTLVLTYLAYFIDSALLTAWYYGLVIMVLFFGLIIYFGKEYRKEVGGFLSFGSAFSFSFFAILISGVVGLVGNILLFHVIDPACRAERNIEKRKRKVDCPAGESSWGFAPRLLGTPRWYYGLR